MQLEKVYTTFHVKARNIATPQKNRKFAGAVLCNDHEAGSDFNIEFFRRLAHPITPGRLVKTPGSTPAP